MSHKTKDQKSKTTMLHPVILCGGSGSRLWPLSQPSHPKQFLPLLSEHSLLQEMLLRLNGLPDCAAPVLLCNHQHRFLAAEQARAGAVEPQVLLLEPVARNTAAAIATAALYLAERDSDALLLVLAADIFIADATAFHGAVTHAAQVAAAGYLVAFGLTPTRPETGFGYIEQGAPLVGAFEIAQFTEKPDLDTAREYLNSGRYLWNSGLFLFPAALLLCEMETHCPAVLRCCREALAKARCDADFCRLEENAFAASPALSIDRAVMEKTNRGAVMPAAFGWSDVGSWSTLWEEGAKDAAGNVARGEIVSFDTHDSYIRAETRLVATVGVENLIVVETADAILVARKDRAQDVRQVALRLQSERDDS
jgi:mannose-1-phosphate guanylyltransferase/mannose-6-phosphate isomerase